MTRKEAAVVFIITAVFGLIFMTIGGIVLASRFLDKKRCTYETTGIVSYLEERDSGERRNKVSYAPVFSYEYEGKQYTYSAKIASNPAPFKVGENVTVMVCPEDPTVVYIPEYTTDLWFGWIFAGIGAAVVLGGLIPMIVVFRRTKRPETVQEEIAQYMSGESSGYGSELDELNK